MKKLPNKPVITRIGSMKVVRRRGLGKKNPIRVAAEASNDKRALALVGPKGMVPTKVMPNGKLLDSVRAYKEVSAVGGINSDWAVNALSEDSDIWQNIFLLRQRSRDLFRIDAHFAKYTEELWANTFGSEGITLRMGIQETDDRPIKSMRERAFIKAWNRRRDRVNQFVVRKYGERFQRSLRGESTAQSGDTDVYSNNLIENAWKEWQRREFCTVAGRLNYQETRQVRLLSAARDGDFFIRHIKDPKVNKFGYSLQLINSEWCDFYLNTTLRNGNEVRMGIERDKWGRPLNYFFIKRQPMDWQYSIPGAFNYSAANLHQIIPADEIIHYARYRDGDSTRPAPWSTPVIVKSRHLDKYEEAEVASSRLAACKMGMFYSDVVPDGGMRTGEDPDPTQANTLEAEPGSFQGLPWGVKFQEWNPTHPTQNFPAFRKEMLRSWCAGLPGANYNIIANDLEGVNYSSGRLGMLDERELWKLLQKFDIEMAERPIFEAWLEMSLMTGAIPLPLAQFDKFNKPIFRGRRWAWVDPFKEVQASAMQVANKFISRTRVIEDSDVDADFEQILFELAEEEMLMEELGMDSTPVVGKVSPAKPAQDEADDENDESDDDKTKDFALQLVKALAPQVPVTVHTPPIQVNPQTIEVKIPEQKTPVVNVSPQITVPEIKMPEQKEPKVVVNVAPPAVHIKNDVRIPATKKVKVIKGDDGKMSGIEIEKE